MNKVFLALFLLLPFFCQAQKEELKQWCKKMDLDFNGVHPLHVQYIMTIVGRSEQPGKESLTFDLFKAGDNSKIIMGNAQDVVQAGKLEVIANHVDKFMTVNPDKTASLNDPSFFGILTALVDSAASVKKKADQTFTYYTVYYSKEYIYSSIRFCFQTQSKQIVSLYAEFNPIYPEPYYSMEIAYKKWDSKWKPELGFPNMEKYVVKKGDRYQAQAQWKGYNFFQHEKGKL
jgi:hypothetical protein